ncbi:MAG: hypothetical protein MR877_02470 [Spirochaetia bacterium]|nr:hypothetical protein [Spirochaetia bacterium]
MNDLGSSWYINSDVDSVEVFKITEDMITAKILKKYDSDLSLCNLGRENLKNMFYDKDGWVYFKAEKYYRFNLQIKEFVKK